MGIEQIFLMAEDVLNLARQKGVPFRRAVQQILGWLLTV